MLRSSLEIRDAVPEDAEALLGLWADAGSRASEQGPTPRPIEEAVAALAQIAADPDERIAVGFHDGTLVAALHMRRGPLSPLHTEMGVNTSYLLVKPEYRKHGFARVLLEVAVSWAEDKDAAHVTAITASNSRDTNRFLARLGLATVATVRVANTGVLRRKLTPEALRPHDARRNLGRILAQRRSIQRRALEADADGSEE
ncbi:MAG: GCN5-related N-acetyltransferase [Marmoricola sp.]|nr:GCN5-related N-acetyltransferase [Marmoricola sp.]